MTWSWAYFSSALVAARGRILRVWRRAGSSRSRQGPPGSRRGSRSAPVGVRRAPTVLHPCLALPPGGGDDLARAPVADHDPVTEPPLHLGGGHHGFLIEAEDAVELASWIRCKRLPGGKEMCPQKTGRAALEVCRRKAKYLTEGWARNEATRPFAGDYGDGAGGDCGRSLCGHVRVLRRQSMHRHRWSRYAQWL
jgi:hypothetical protein